MKTFEINLKTSYSISNHYRILANGTYGGILVMPTGEIHPGDDLVVKVMGTRIGDLLIFTRALSYGSQKNAIKIRINRLQMEISGLEQGDVVEYEFHKLE